ncbi:hypothetical protein [Comamonas testosteroni]|uniref:hypothetical protein n=1 Tax=Comamonas testosteroni TaxID=285 RepID=UPI0003116D22|nr:hypothetical protein [Comamonas testosteroni]
MNMHPETPPGNGKPDVLRELYHEAVAEDRGPSAQSSAAILERARQRAAGAPADQPAANDRYWLRHALGGLAAVGLVGWLMLQHAAWWSGPDQGRGGEPDSRAEAVARPEGDAASQAADAQRATPEPAASAASAERAAAQTPESRGSRASVQTEKAPEALGMEAAVSASAPMPPFQAAPAPSAAPAARGAPAAKASSRSTDAVQPVAPAADAMAPQNSRLSAQLPLCPLQTEDQGRRRAAKEGAEEGSGAARKLPHCRPRKPEQLPPVKSESGQGAAEDVAKPQR